VVHSDPTNVDQGHRSEFKVTECVARVVDVTSSEGFSGFTNSLVISDDFVYSRRKVGTAVVQTRNERF